MVGAAELHRHDTHPLWLQSVGHGGCAIQAAAHAQQARAPPDPCRGAAVAWEGVENEQNCLRVCPKKGARCIVYSVY
eukprot:1150295-Pelagomonas_calceolata.AAC.7